jgi:4'-phosphopantetheinyl transferase
VAEQKALSDLQGRELVDGFYRCWTRKESYVKARGAGLQIDLQSFDVSVEPGRGALVCSRSADPEASEWTITKLDIAEGYAGAVTLHGRRDVTCRMFNWDRLDSPSIYGAH